MVWYELMRWWAYRRIKHPQMRFYVWYAPLGCAALCLLALIVSPSRPTLAGASGILASVVEVLAILPGFFIAALSAVAVFSNDYIDRELPAPTPTIPTKIKGNIQPLDLSRRMFLLYLLSYLTVLSLLLLVFSAVGAKVFDPVYIAKDTAFLPEILRSSSYFLTAAVFFYFCSSMIVSTLHAVFFLSERVHTPL